MDLGLTKLPIFDKTGVIGRTTKHSIEKDKTFKFNMSPFIGMKDTSKLPKINNIHNDKDNNFSPKNKK